MRCEFLRSAANSWQIPARSWSPLLPLSAVQMAIVCMSPADPIACPQQPPLPWVGGSEFSGVVLSAPRTGSTKFKPGDGVFGASQGAFATRICAKEANLQPIPKNWSFQEAAALYLTGPTSYAALTLRGRLEEGKTPTFICMS